MPAKRSHHFAKRTRKSSPYAFGSRTDIGNVRDHNEDSLMVKPPLFVIADGMGGHAAGEVASEIAVKTIVKYAPEYPDAQGLGRAVEQANRAIIDAALAGRGSEGMGTTCTAAMLDEDLLVIAQVGDSRAYLLHDGQLQQLTRDHSLMADMIESGQITPEEARFHPNRSVITRALGNDPATRPDLYEMNVEAGDRLLLCSDGLSSMIEDDEIESVLARVADPQHCAVQLTNRALEAGGLDNVTVIVVNIKGKADAQRKKVARKTKLTVAFVFTLFVALIVGAGWGMNTYLHNAAYLADEHGYVAIYRGVPDAVLGFSYSELVEVTNVPTADLPAGTAARIQEKWRVSDVAEARTLVDGYRADIQERSKDRRSHSSDESTQPPSKDSSKTSDGSHTPGASEASGTPGASRTSDVSRTTDGSEASHVSRISGASRALGTSYASEASNVSGSSHTSALSEPPNASSVHNSSAITKRTGATSQLNATHDVMPWGLNHDTA